jgi:hypothetical protein
VTKPSDTPERRRERKGRHDRRKRLGRLADDANALAETLPREVMSHFWDRAFAGELPYSPGQTPIAVFHRLLEDLVGRNFDIWEMITGETLESLPKTRRLALGAYLADRERIERESRQRGSKDARGWKKGIWTGARAGEPWGSRFDRSRWRCFDTEGPEFEDFVELWGFSKRIVRFGMRRELRLKTGKAKWFEIGRAASAVRHPPLSVFVAKRTFPANNQWYQRLYWPQARWPSKPAKARQIYRPPAANLGIEGQSRRFLWTKDRPAVPPAGAPSVLRLSEKKLPERGPIWLVCSDYPRGWAAEKGCGPVNTPLERRATQLRNAWARAGEVAFWAMVLIAHMPADELSELAADVATRKAAVFG